MLLNSLSKIANKGLFSRIKSTRIPSFIEKEHVHKTYDSIAEHFDHTRFARWPKVQQFLNDLE